MQLPQTPPFLQLEGSSLHLRASPGIRPALGGVHVLDERPELVQGQLANHQAAASAAALAGRGQGVLPCQHSLGHGAVRALAAARAADGSVHTGAGRGGLIECTQVILVRAVLT